MDSSEMDKGCDDKGMRHREGPGLHRQRGSVLVLVAAGMLAIIGMAGLALQSGHLFVDKTHLQNALDAAALSAAKTLNNGGTVAEAGTAGQLAFGKYKGCSSNSTFLEREVCDASYTLAFQFSATLDPFTETSVPPATFVRARVTGFTMDTWLANVLPGVGDQQSIGGTAVAGPVPVGECPSGVLPLLICARNPADPDTDCSDGSCFGFNPPENGEVCLASGAPGAGPSGRAAGGGGGGGGGAGGGGGGGGGGGPPGACAAFENGRGNFHLLALGNPGAAVLKENLAGGYSEKVCVGDQVGTEPGVVTGPVFEGFNSRFGLGHMDPTRYPPDTVTYSEGDGSDGSCTFCYDDYQSRQQSQNYDHDPIPDGDGVAERRRVPIPIGRCEEDAHGRTNVTVLGIGCVFLTRPAKHTGADREIYGQLVGECEADGPVATTPPPAGGGAYRIVLYKDPDSQDS